MSRRSGFIPRLESLRGIAALLVAASHVVQTPIGSGQTLLTVPGEGLSSVTALTYRAIVHAVDGLQAVIFFFVLSGFVLTRSLLNQPAGPTAAQAGEFAIGRIFRLFPAIVAVIGGYAVAMALVGQPIALPLVLSNMALFDVSLNGVMWSLQLELLATPLIYLMYVLLNRGGTAPLALAIGVSVTLVVLSFDPSFHKSLGSPSLQFTYAFTFGCFCAAVSGRRAAALSPLGINIAIAICLVVFFTARPLLGPASTWRFLVNALSASMLVYFVAYGPRAAILNVLDHPAAHWLGKLSYSFYLLHFLTMTPFWQHPEWLGWLVSGLGVPRAIAALLLLGITSIVALGLAYVCYRFVELPGIRLGNYARKPLAPSLSR